MEPKTYSSWSEWFPIVSDSGTCSTSQCSSLVKAHAELVARCDVRGSARAIRRALRPFVKINMVSRHGS